MTCAHVVHDNKGLVVYRPGDLKKLPVSIRKSDLDTDLAIVDFVDAPPVMPTFTQSKEEPKEEDQVVLLGHPYVGPGGTGIIDRGAVKGHYSRFGQPRIMISCEIAAGNSGGPVLDRKLRVIGVAANGNERIGIRGAELYGVIPISQLAKLAE